MLAVAVRQMDTDQVGSPFRTFRQAISDLAVEWVEAEYDFWLKAVGTWCKNANVS